MSYMIYVYLSKLVVLFKHFIKNNFIYFYFINYIHIIKNIIKMKFKLSTVKPPNITGAGKGPFRTKLAGRKIIQRPKPYLSHGAIKEKGPKYKLVYKNPINIKKSKK